MNPPQQTPVQPVQESVRERAKYIHLVMNALPDVEESFMRKLCEELVYDKMNLSPLGEIISLYQAITLDTNPPKA
jgi:hypothetical protein